MVGSSSQEGFSAQVRSRARGAVLCGNADDGQAVRDVVAIEHPEVRVLVAAPDVGEALGLHDTDLVLLAQRDLAANRQALRALEAVPDGLDRRHTRIVLLCHKDEVREAYDLGRSLVVDDYVQYGPMALDGYRLRMCLLDQVRWLGEARAGRVPLVPERAAPAAADGRADRQCAERRGPALPRRGHGRLPHQAHQPAGVGGDDRGPPSGAAGRGAGRGRAAESAAMTAPATPATPHQMPPETDPSPTPLRVGLMGWGGASQVFHAPLIRHTPGLRLVALSTSRPDAARAALGPAVDLHPDPAALLARGDLDLVVIPPPHATPPPLALAALRAGCAVLVDKPFALDEAQGRELVDEADRRGLLLSVFHNRRWDADFLTARELLRAGALGTVRHVRMRFDRFRPVVRARWREGDGPGAGLWMDLGPHLLDQALQLFGRPQAVRAELWVERPGGVGIDAFTARLC